MLLSTALALLGALCPAPLQAPEESAQEEAFPFQVGDRVCLVGGALAERMQHHGWLETRLQLRFPKRKLSFRNLGFNGDELEVKQRTAGFMSQDEFLEHCKADVVFAFFGYNESFAGKAGLAGFRADLRDYIDHTTSRSYNGESPTRLVLFTPTSFEERLDPSFPRAADRNENIELYAKAILEIGRQKQIPVVDLFQPTRQQFESSPVNLTINGIHFSEGGNDILAALIEDRLVGLEPPSLQGTRAREIRAAVLEKNRLWFNRYRATDGFNVYGGRSGLKYVDEQSNFTVLQRGLEVLDAMTENLDREIWGISRGDGVGYPTVVVPRQIDVKTNKPGAGEGGEHVFQSAEVAITSMTVPDGLQVQLFADEEQFPELVNPVQMAWDARGRLWVAVWPTYPHWRPGDPMNDKLLILEDTDGDGRADLCKTFADGLHNPTGFEFWMGGVFLACAPELLYLEDIDGDDRVDHTEHILGGLSSADTHHGANSFVIGQDGALYFQEGTFHMSQIESIYGPVRNRNGCVWRFEPRTFRVERYIPYNFANPHGHVFDAWGQDFMTDGTGNANYYSLAFSGHVTEPAKHSGYFTFFDQNTRPAAATEFLVSEHFPEPYQNNYLIANVIGRQGILRYEVVDEGSGFNAEELEPLVMSSDPNFRPVDLEVAPDGSLYFLDWQNPIIGHMQHHLRDPSRDGAHGRIYRLRHEDRPLLEPISAEGRSIPELLELLEEDMDRLRYRARMELSRHDRDQVIPAVHEWLANLDAGNARYEHQRLEALWLQQQFDVLDSDLALELLASEDHRARAAATRVLRQLRHLATNQEDWLAALERLVEDSHPRVRLEAVIALSFLQDARAAELCMRALLHPTDRFLDYAIGETLRELKPSWRAALVRGDALAADNPRGLQYILRQLSSADLLNVPGNELVWAEQLVRHELLSEEYIAAARGLAELHGSSPTNELLDAIFRADLRTQGHVDHLISNLFGALGESVEQESPQLVERLDSIARNSKRTTTRRLTVVAQLKVGSSVEALWSTAEESLGGLVDLLDAATLVNDEQLARDLFPRVLARFETSRVEPDQGTRGRFVRIDLPGKARTLTLAEVEIFHRDLNLALGGKAIQSGTNWGGVASRAIDGNKSGSWANNGQTHTPENQPDPWWEVDLQEELPIDRVSVWNRDDSLELAARLEGFELSILDGKRRTIFKTRVEKPGRNETVIDVLAPEELLQRVSIPALAKLSSYDPVQRQLAIQTMIDRFDNQWVRDEIVGSFIGLADSEWPKGSRELLARKLMTLFEESAPREFMSLEGRHLLALADSLAPKLEATQSRELLTLRESLGPRVLVIRPVPDSLLYDIDEFSVLAGRPVELIFENTDIMPHNLVFTAPGKLAEVGRAGEAMSADPQAWMKGYVPEIPSVLHFVGLLQPGSSETLRFVAPRATGDYPYVCTFPGHWIRMNGVMHVVDDPLAQAQAPRTEVAADAPAPRKFVKNWTPADFDSQIGDLASRSAPRGRGILEAASCLRCHRIEEEGTSTGPSLRTTVQKYDRKTLLEHILQPSSQIAEGYQAELILLKDGEFLAGIVLDEQAQELHLRDDPYRDDFLVIEKGQIAEREVSKLSTMPDGLLTTFQRGEILDLMAFLDSLREEQ